MIVDLGDEMLYNETVTEETITRFNSAVVTIAYLDCAPSGHIEIIVSSVTRKATLDVA